MEILENRRMLDGVPHADPQIVTEVSISAHSSIRSRDNSSSTSEVVELFTRVGVVMAQQVVAGAALPVYVPGVMDPRFGQLAQDVAALRQLYAQIENGNRPQHSDIDLDDLSFIIQAAETELAYLDYKQGQALTTYFDALTDALDIAEQSAQALGIGETATDILDSVPDALPPNQKAQAVRAALEAAGRLGTAIGDAVGNAGAIAGVVGAYTAAWADKDDPGAIASAFGDMIGALNPDEFAVTGIGAVLGFYTEALAAIGEKLSEIYDELGDGNRADVLAGRNPMRHGAPWSKSWAGDKLKEYTDQGWPPAPNIGGFDWAVEFPGERY